MQIKNLIQVGRKSNFYEHIPTVLISYFDTLLSAEVLSSGWFDLF